MKKLLFAVAIAFAFVACKNDKNEIATEKTHTTEEKKADTPTNYVWWKGGHTIGDDNHFGKIQFSDIDFVIEDDKLVGGELVVNMKTLSTDDIKDEAKAAKLIGHLSNEDFFEVNKYPTATFKILEVIHPADGEAKEHKVTGALTIKGVTKNITVPATISVKEGKVNFESEFEVDRTDFNVHYGSPTKFVDIAKDKALKDEVELKVVIDQQ